MRRSLLLLVFFLVVLSACGNKGDLYLPPATDKNTTTAPVESEPADTDKPRTASDEQSH